MRTEKTPRSERPTTKKAKQPKKRTALELARQYYGAWGDGQPLDPEIFAEDLKFEGSVAQFEGRDAFLGALAQMPPMTLEKKHLEIANGDDVVTFFDCGMAGATIPMSEWIHAEDGQIRSIKLVYDSARFPKA